MKLNRRRFLKTFLGAGGILATLSSFNQKWDTQELELNTIKLKISDLSPLFEGYKIAFISDIHFGVFVSSEFIQKAVEQINQHKPDLILLGGDYIGIPDNLLARTFHANRNNKFLKPNNPILVQEIISDLKNLLSELHAPDGILAVLGNHDHWNDAEICIQTFSDSPITLLINQSVSIQRSEASIRIFGTDDYWTGIPNVKELIQKEASKNEMKILLSHNPDYFVEVLRLHGPIFDLGLAGHTHGGQIKIKGLGAIAGYNSRYNRFTEGHYNSGQSQVYVSRGLGVVDIPHRLNCPPEINIFELSKT